MIKAVQVFAVQPLCFCHKKTCTLVFLFLILPYKIIKD